MDALIVDVYVTWLSWAIKQEWCKNLTPILTSGCPAVRGTTYVSDVDINVLVTRELLERLLHIFEDEGLRPKSHFDKGWITVTFVGYDLEVNVRFTVNKDQLVRTLTHRHNEALLAVTYPKLAEKVAELKLNPDGTKRMSTEPAWAEVLQFTGSKDDAYEYMNGPLDQLLEAAKKVNSLN